MSLILQNQRRALESFHESQKNASPLLICFVHGDTFTLNDGSNFYALGVSRGFGTCSGVRDVNILVLGTSPPVSPPNFYSEDETFIVECLYAALLRPVTAEERNKFYGAGASDPLFKDNPLLCAELLALKDEEPDCFCVKYIFEKTARTALYIPI